MTKEATELHRWDDLRVFLATAAEGSLSEAARTLGMDQSTLSRRLSGLEEELQAVLFERTRSGCVLTHVGERVLDEARAMERSAHQFLDAVKQEDKEISGPVRIALVEGLAIHFLIPEVLPVLERKFPNVSIELVTGTAPADLLKHEADIALRFFRETQGDLTLKKLGKLKRTILVSRKQKKKLRGRPIEDLNWVGGTLDALEGLWLKEIGVKHLHLSTNSYEAQLAAIRSGLGVGIGTSLLAQLSDDLDVLSPPLPTPPPLELFLVTRTSARRTPRVRAVSRVLTEELRALFKRDAYE